MIVLIDLFIILTLLTIDNELFLEAYLEECLYDDQWFKK